VATDDVFNPSKLFIMLSRESYEVIWIHIIMGALFWYPSLC